MLTLADAPEAFCISVKHGVEGIGEILRRPISSALSRAANFERLDLICDILFSQLCLRIHSTNGMPSRDFKCLGNLFGCPNESYKGDLVAHPSQGPQQKKSTYGDVLPGSITTTPGTDHSTLICETASVAALLLRGYAVVPMQLVARVRTSLFYWPLIQLAGAATDDIALGVAVGSKARGNLPGATSRC